MGEREIGKISTMGRNCQATDIMRIERERGKEGEMSGSLVRIAAIIGGDAGVVESCRRDANNRIKIDRIG